MTAHKKLLLASTVLFVLAFSLTQTSQADDANAANSTAEDKLPAFLSEVIGLDLTKYNITNEGYGVSYPPEFGGLVKRENIIFTLESNNSKIPAAATFDNGFISWLHFYPSSGSMIYAKQPSTDALDESRNILQRYQLFCQNHGINASHVAPAHNMLNSIPDSPTDKAFSGNINNMSDFTPC